MDRAELASILASMGPLEDDGAALRLVVDGVRITCLTDEPQDRMRLVTPVMEAAAMAEADKDAVLAANFHSALDARYAVFDGVLFSAFIHRLSTLTEEDARAAVGQVQRLAATYGTSYHSGDLVFGGS